MKKFFFIIISITLSFSASAQNWDSLQNGVGYQVRAMFGDTIDNYLYVAGMFKDVSGKHIKGIARWNGSQWDSLGHGIDGMDTANQWPQNTLAITRYNNEIYVGGAFLSLGNVPAKKLGKWNGIQWDTLSVMPFSPNCNGCGGYIKTLSVINGSLYVGGAFDTIAGIPCTSIAKWDGSNWTSIGMPPNMNGFTPQVEAICEYQNEIYIAGNFHSTAYPNDSIKSILRWDGTNFKTVGGGMKGSSSWVESMVVYNGELYAAGYFFKSSGNTGNHIQKWNGTTWSEVGGGTWAGQIHKLLIHNGKLYAFGTFDTAGGVPAQCIASWDGTQWCGLGSAFDNGIGSAAVMQDTLYIGGGFWTIDGASDTLNYIAKWVGGSYVDTCGANTGIKNETLNQNNILLFPNPANEILNVSFELQNETKIKITDLTGKIVSEIRVENLTGKTIQQINISSLSSGIYFVQLSNGNEIYSKKFIKQ